MDWMQRKYKLSKFILTGLCGGAITGLLAGAKDKRVECLMGQSIPIILDSSNIVYDDFLTDAELKKKGKGILGNCLTLNPGIPGYAFSHSEVITVLFIDQCFNLF